MRGKESDDGQRKMIGRITPAYAGKSLKRRMRQFGCQDHPRLCGEKAFALPAASTSSGSPPPMRGKAPARAHRRALERITPAYAGKSPTTSRTSRGHWDHPRLCGEKFCFVLLYQSIIGSPPPMRGKGAVPASGEMHNGITPAYAGKSAGSGSPSSTSRDHPRLCGEKGRT